MGSPDAVCLKRRLKGEKLSNPIFRNVRERGRVDFKFDAFQRQTKTMEGMKEQCQLKKLPY